MIFLSVLFISFNYVFFVALEACGLLLEACGLRLISLKNFSQLARYARGSSSCGRRK